MKLNRFLRSCLGFWFLVSAPIAVLLYVFITLIFLQQRINSSWVYVVSYLIIALLWICSFVFFFTKTKNYCFDNSSYTDLAVAKEENFKPTLVLVSLALCIFALWSIRLNYNGYAYDGVEISEITGGKTTLPIFSDEWLYAGFAKKTAERHELPFFSPFGDMAVVQDSLQSNFLAPYIASLAGFMIGTGVDVVTRYHLYVFAFHFVFVLIFYAFLRSFRISRFASVLGLVLFLCLPESNLAPGIWIMLPAYVGLSFVLGGMILINNRLAHSYVNGLQSTLRWQKWRMLGIGANFVTASLLYPPYLVLVVLGLVLRYLKSPIKIIWLFSIAGAIALIVTRLAGHGMIISFSGLGDIIKIIWDMFVRHRVGAATESIWSFIPIPFFFMAIAGLFIAFTKKGLEIFQKFFLLLASSIIGILVISTYLFDKEIILSHQRAVFMLWILMIAMVCFFVDFIIEKVSKWRNGQLWLRITPMIPLSRKSALIIFSILCIILFAYVSLSGTYQKIPPWKGVIANVDFLIGPVPSRPIMLSMLPRDFEEKLQNKKGKFIADPYISLAIGATTNLQPISASPSFITINGPTLADFKKINTCEGKYDFAIDNSLSLFIVYISDNMIENCPEFKFSGNLGEHYLLYDRI